MSILKKLREMLKIGFLSDSGLKKFIHESGINPDRDYAREIAENTKLLAIETEKQAEEMEKLRKALAKLSESIKEK